MKTITINYRDQFGYTSTTCEPNELPATIADLIICQRDVEPISATLRVDRRIREIIADNFSQLIIEAAEGLDRLGRW